MNEPLVS